MSMRRLRIGGDPCRFKDRGNCFRQMLALPFASSSFVFFGFGFLDHRGKLEFFRYNVLRRLFPNMEVTGILQRCVSFDNG